MRVHEYAKDNDLTVKEVKDKFGLKSHMSLIPEDEKETVQEIVVVEPIRKPVKPPVDDVPMLVKINSCKMLGVKSQYWNELNG